MNKLHLKNKLFLNKGLYDNKQTIENTIEAFKDALLLNIGLYLTVRETKDHRLIIYEDNNLSRLHNVKDKIVDTTYDDLNYLSYYHIPTLDEALNIIDGKVDLILNLKINSKNKEIYNILDNYKGTFVIIGKPLTLYKINKNRENYLTGEINTKLANFSLTSLIIKPDFISYDIDFYDKIKLNKLKENRKVIGYLANTNEKYQEFKDKFDYLVVDNYQNLDI